MESTPKSHTPTDSWVALLGRGQTDADGIEDYCHYLGEALQRRGVALSVFRLDWQRLGWKDALAQLGRESHEWRGRWVLVQYTALAFSSRGFPFRALEVLRILRRNGVRCAVVFHDPSRHGGRRLRDRFRGNIQEWVIRRLFAVADAAIFPDPLAKIGWLPRETSKAFSVPIGANIPELSGATRRQGSGQKGTVAVFCLSPGAVGAEELEDISEAVRVASMKNPGFRLIFLGRGTDEARSDIALACDGILVEISVMGILEPEELSETLASVDAMICVRGKLYPRRGSAIAGIACGLPILGYSGAADHTPIAEAGVMLVPYRDTEALGQALARVLEEPALAQELRSQSLSAYRKFFSWDIIAEKYVSALQRQT